MDLSVKTSHEKGYKDIALLRWRVPAIGQASELTTDLERPDNDLSIKVDTIDEQRFISGLEKIANRITLGISDAKHHKALGMADEHRTNS